MERLIAIVIVALVAAGNVFAGGTEQLRNFLSATQAVRGKFDQTITDQNGKVVRQTSGTLEFSRPGKFRWEYGTPFKQTIVGDGEKVWLYDPDLNQVTVRKIDDAIGSSPAALLAGDAAIEKNFTLKDGGVEGKREWVEATPASKESSFERVRMAFAGGTLETMELKDNFGQTTLLRFSAMERNVKFPASTFRFTPPKGADVITQK